MSALLVDGWIVVDCDADDLTAVHISVGITPPNWKAAFRDWDGDRRIAKVRPEGYGRHDVYLRVGDVVSKAGRVTLP